MGKLLIYLRRPVQSDHILFQAFRYLIVGGICTVLDFVILFLLVQECNISYLKSSILSFMSGTVLNYFLCSLLVFHTHRVKSRYWELLAYGVITFIGLGINTGAIWLFTDILGFYFMLSKCGAVFFTYFWNFGARKYLLHFQ